jgi:hypothetical protein
MGIAGVLFHESALGGPGYDARDERIWELLEEVAELTAVIVIGADHEELDGYDVAIIPEEPKAPEAFNAIAEELEADAASYLYIDPDKERLKAAKKAGFLTHRLVTAELLDERLRHEKVLPT